MKNRHVKVISNNDVSETLQNEKHIISNGDNCKAEMTNKSYMYCSIFHLLNVSS